MKRKNDQNIKDVLSQFVKSSEKIQKGVATVRIAEIYKAEMGEVVASYTTDIKLRGDTLYINVTSAPLRAELMNARFKLMDVLNQSLGSNIIKKVRIR